MSAYKNVDNALCGVVKVKTGEVEGRRFTGEIEKHVFFETRTFLFVLACLFFLVGLLILGIMMVIDLYFDKVCIE